MQADAAKETFTQEQIAWLERRFGPGRSTGESGYDKGTLRTVAAGLFALGLAATAFLYSEIGSVRDELRGEIGFVRDELRSELRAEIGSVRGEIGSLRDQVQDNRAALARIEAILDERLPRDN